MQKEEALKVRVNKASELVYVRLKVLCVCVCVCVCVVGYCIGASRWLARRYKVVLDYIGSVDCFV